MKTPYLLLIGLLFLGINTSAQDELTQDLQWRSIGPANMMGRIAAVEALNTDYRHVLVGSASGGAGFVVWVRPAERTSAVE